MLLKKRLRLIFGFLFILLAIILVIYLFALGLSFEDYRSYSILSILIAVVSLIFALLGNLNIRRGWKKNPSTPDDY